MKGYSLDSIVAFIQRVAAPETVVLPILNIYGTGGKMQEMLPDVDVLDGCTYLYAEIQKPGTILQSGPYCRIVFGPRDHNLDDLRYQQIKRDFDASGIVGELTAHIQRDALQKFSYVSPVGATGLYYNAVAADMQKDGEARDCFIAMVREISALADAMGCPFDHDVVPDDLAILDGIAPTATTSMQRDIADGHRFRDRRAVYEVCLSWRKIWRCRANVHQSSRRNEKTRSRLTASEREEAHHDPRRDQCPSCQSARLF